MSRVMTLNRNRPKNEASGDAFGEGSGDVKPTVNVKPFKVKIPFQARINNIEEPKPVPIGVVFEGRDTASFLQQIQDGESDKSYFIGFVDKG